MHSNAVTGDTRHQLATSQIKSLAQSLAQEYQSSIVGQDKEGGSCGARPGMAPAGTDLSALVFQLNHTGRYLELKEQLQEEVMKV